MSERGGNPPPPRQPLVQIPSYVDVFDSAPSRPALNFFRSRSAGPTLAPQALPSSSQPVIISPPQRPEQLSLREVSQSESNVLRPGLQRQPDGAPSRTSGQRSFSETFSFVKASKFYTPPPPLPPGGTETTPGLQAGEAPAGVNPGSRPGAARAPQRSLQSQNAIIVSKRQQGNPVLKQIRNVRWQFGDIVPDYLLGASSCALYLSLRYHLLHPEYLYFRIRELQKAFRLRIVLCHVDVDDVIKPLHEVMKTALLHECTLLCAWSVEECARYLETIKSYENKPADVIQERQDSDYVSRLSSALTTVRSVNRSDVLTLGSNFGSLARMMGASMEELARCPGIGERKVKRLYDAFQEPFRRTSKQLRLSSLGITVTPGDLLAVPPTVTGSPLTPREETPGESAPSGPVTGSQEAPLAAPSNELSGGRSSEADKSEREQAGASSGSVRAAVEAAKAKLATIRKGAASRRESL